MFPDLQAIAFQRELVLQADPSARSLPLNFIFIQRGAPKAHEVCSKFVVVYCSCRSILRAVQLPRVETSRILIAPDKERPTEPDECSWFLGSSKMNGHSHERFDEDWLYATSALENPLKFHGVFPAKTQGF